MSDIPLSTIADGRPTMVSTPNGNYELPDLKVYTTRDYSLSSTSLEFAILVLDGIVIGTIYRPKKS